MAPARVFGISRQSQRVEVGADGQAALLMGGVDEAVQASAAPAERGKSPMSSTTTSLSSIPQPTQSALRTLEWVRRRENPVVCGPNRTGKTLFLEALGQTAVEVGVKVAWFSLEVPRRVSPGPSGDDSVTPRWAVVLTRFSGQSIALVPTGQIEPMPWYHRLLSNGSTAL